MKHVLLILIFAVNLFAISCSHNDEPNSEIKPTSLVIEGWIEDEAKPVVIVTRMADLSVSSGPIDDLVQRWCRITVSDGNESEVLGMHINYNYTPPVIYTSSKLKGKVGHTYSLIVETDLDTAYAFTTIPPVARIENLKIEMKDNTPDTYTIKMLADVDSTKSRYYKLFTKVNREPRYYSSFLGLFSFVEYDQEKGWNVAKGIHNTYEGHFTPSYALGDTVSIKLCTLDENAYRFWKSYESAVSLQSNFFFSSTDEVEGNIIGGKGYWAGYGTSFGRCIIR